MFDYYNILGLLGCLFGSLFGGLFGASWRPPSGLETWDGVLRLFERLFGGLEPF